MDLTDFLAALGLMLVFEGILYGGFPAMVRRMAAQMETMPDSTLRRAGIAVAVFGVFLVWIARG